MNNFIDKEMGSILNEIISYSYKFTGNSDKIKEIFIYISLEDNWWSFLMSILK